MSATHRGAYSDHSFAVLVTKCKSEASLILLGKLKEKVKLGKGRG